jgi:hypothetical protein
MVIVDVHGGILLVFPSMEDIFIMHFLPHQLQCNLILLKLIKVKFKMCILLLQMVVVLKFDIKANATSKSINMPQLYKTYV